MFTFLFPQIIWHDTISNHAHLKKQFNQGLENIEYHQGDWGGGVKTTFQQESMNATWEAYLQSLQQPLQRMLQNLQMEAEVEAVVRENWKNLYNKGDFQEVHTHDPSDFSIVYFVNYDPEKDARLCIYNQHKADTQFLNRFDSIWARQYHPSYYVLDEVKEGDLVIFPSTTPHFTQLQQHSTNRLTVASNLSLKRLDA